MAFSEVPKFLHEPKKFKAENGKNCCGRKNHTAPGTRRDTYEPALSCPPADPSLHTSTPVAALDGGLGEPVGRGSPVVSCSARDAIWDGRVTGQPQWIDSFNTNGKNPSSLTENQREKEPPPRRKAKGVRQLTRYKQFFRVRLLSSLQTRHARKVPLFSHTAPGPRLDATQRWGVRCLLLHSGGKGKTPWEGNL